MQKLDSDIGTCFERSDIRTPDDIHNANSIAMIYIVLKYKKKFESTNMDLKHLKFLILGFPVKGVLLLLLLQYCPGHETFGELRAQVE